MSGYKYDLSEDIELHGWIISTKIQGEISSVSDKHHGVYSLSVDGQEVVNILIYFSGTMKISTVEGYAVQLLPRENDKYISVIKEGN